MVMAHAVSSEGRLPGPEKYPHMEDRLGKLCSSFIRALAAFRKPLFS